DRVAIGGGWRLGQDPSSGLQAVQLGHPDVHQHHVGAQPARGGHRFQPVGGLPADFGVGGGQDHGEAAADQRLVVGDHHPGHAGSSGASSPALASNGSRARTRNPPPTRRPVSSVPPYRRTRSATPRGPVPEPPPAPGRVPGGGASLVTSITRSVPRSAVEAADAGSVDGSVVITISVRAPGAWRSALVNASCTTR